MARPQVEALESRSLLSALSPAPDPQILEVGPGKPYSMPSAAIAAAHDGDTIEIDSSGDYYNDVALINKNDLTIIGVGPGRALISTDGRVYDDKGIWLFALGYQNLTVENLDFEGAHISEADGANGAGIRAQGDNLTVINCRFYDNQTGILGGYGTTTIEYSEFVDNGLNDYAHNLYISDEAGTLIFEYNYTHDAVGGHLLKSRAAVNQILYNRISDDGGIASYEIDLPNGGQDDVVGNIIEQDPTSPNAIILAYGEEGIVNGASELNVVNNTFVNNRSNGTFIYAAGLPPDFRLEAENNIFAGPGTDIYMSAGTPITGGNLVTTIADAGFVDPANDDYHLQATSPAIDLGIDPGTDGMGMSLTPDSEYVQPTSGQARYVDQVLDAGAYEYEPASASFLGTDTTTGGSWVGTYGGDGYDLEGDTSGTNPVLPSYANVSITGYDTYTWGTNTGSPYALQNAGQNGDIAATWLSATSFDIHVGITDGQAHQVSLYALDWDNVDGSPFAMRSERFDVYDASGTTLLATTTISDFQGEYVSFIVSGAVDIRVTNLTAPGQSSNAVVSGIFFDTTT